MEVAATGVGRVDGEWFAIDWSRVDDPLPIPFGYHARGQVVDDGLFDSDVSSTVGDLYATNSTNRQSDIKSHCRYFVRFDQNYCVVVVNAIVTSS